jgi:hypothetical protein
MVRGLDRFREHFAAFEDRYVLIGGAAVFVALDDAGIDFRVTKDLDIVLFVESLDAGFARVFWDFVAAGGYENRQKSTGEPRFYRFFSPTEPTYPVMLELFSRRPDAIDIADEGRLTPLPVAEGVPSLSAILLDDEYYEFVRNGARRVEGLSVLGPEHLIPLKAKAWLDLTQRRARGEGVSSDDIKKHSKDVIRLFQLISPEMRVALSPRIAGDVREFLDTAFADAPDPSALGIRGVTLEEVVSDLRLVYGV